MSTSVPDGISFADLQALAKDAPDDSSTELRHEGPFNGLDEDQLKDLVEAHLELIHEACPDPMFVKALLWRLVNNMIGWHTEAGKHQIEDGENDLSIVEDYNSHNTHRLDVEGMKLLLLKLDFIRDIKSGNMTLPEGV